jgi:hypothetical protein
MYGNFAHANHSNMSGIDHTAPIAAPILAFQSETPCHPAGRVPPRNIRRITMPTTEHKKAAALHDDAAKAHLLAADSHAKGDAAKGTEHAKVAQQHAQSAGKQTDHASAKSQQQK